VLLVGWDAADWKLIQPLVDAGRMPVLARFMAEGAMADLATLHPVLSPMLWTSIATGMRPFKHGVLGFTEPNDDATGVRPVTSLSRKVKALWNIFSQSGLRSNVVGWWPSHPVEPIRGAMVSNHYHRARAPIGEPWPLAPGSVHPPRLAQELAELRVHPNELVEEDIRAFIPLVHQVDQERDARVATCLKTIAECASVHSAATWLMQHEPWDFMAVYYDAIDHFCHGFMKYHPPRQECIGERDFELYRHVVDAAYCWHDQLLGRLLALAGDDTTVILVSDHGFHPDHQRPAGIPLEPAGPAVEHRDFGVFAIRGPGVKRDEFVHGVSLLDVAPTILSIYGLPLGEDMDGRPLLECFEAPPAIESIPSWEDVPGDAGRHPAAATFDPTTAQEALAQLVALGYVEAPGADAEKNVSGTVNELRFNLARAYIDADRHAEAVPVLEELVERAPGEYRFGIQLAMCLRALGRIPELRARVEAMTARRLRELEDARRALRERSAARRAAARDTGRRAALTREERRELRRLRALVHFDGYALEFLRGFVAAAEGEPERALAHLARAERAQPGRPGLHLQIGETLLALRRFGEAERAFRRALAIDPACPHAQVGLARSFLPRRRNRAAAEAALEAVGRLHHHPLAHYCLGVALHRMGHVERARQALELAVAQNPNFREAHLRLARVFEERLGDPARAAEHRLLAAQPDARPVFPAALAAGAPDEGHGQAPRARAARARPAADAGAPPVVVVSGLPRSGTSMMMRILARAGLPVLADETRPADEDNPEGYLELEAVKRTRSDASWLAQAGGKAVKVIHLLLPYLPADRPYKVVMMRRDLDEVLASQRRMLARSGGGGARLDAAALRRTFAAQLRRVDQYLARRPCFERIEMDYNALLADPLPQLARLVEFLGLDADPADLAAAIDPRLYRNRAGASAGATATA
jgi:predicted AlkP superfamily phosphohydrolase/phosphomutase/predicted Zn-dependent protease